MRAVRRITLVVRSAAMLSQCTMVDDRLPYKIYNNIIYEILFRSSVGIYLPDTLLLYTRAHTSTGWIYIYVCIRLTNTLWVVNRKRG